MDHLQSVFVRGLAGALLLLALLYTLSALLAIVHMGFRVPLWDQFRSYQLLLEQPFPLNVVNIENGHHPIFPNLLKLFDLWASGGRQWLLLGSGGALALVCWALLVRAAWHEQQAPFLLRCALVLTISIALFWLGNARMLLHGNEAVAVYWVLACLLLGVYGLTTERQPAGLYWSATAIMLGSFGFGNGPVVGCALLLIAALQRKSWRRLAALGLVFAAALLLYTYILPGAEKVQAALFLRPSDNLQMTLRWLSGVWMEAWLGLSDSPSGMLRSALLRQGWGTWLVHSADWLASWFAEPTLQAKMFLSLRLGAFGALLLIGLSYGTYRWRMGSRVLLMGLALAWFALGTALLVGLSRYTYFVWMPSQIFAPRYLPWSCMFWLGLVLATTACFHARWPRLVMASLTSLVLVAAAALGFSHLGWLQWAQETSRRADIMAMALSQGEILEPE